MGCGTRYGTCAGHCRGNAGSFHWSADGSNSLLEFTCKGQVLEIPHAQQLQVAGLLQAEDAHTQSAVRHRLNKASAALRTYVRFNQVQAKHEKVQTDGATMCAARQ